MRTRTRALAALLVMVAGCAARSAPLDAPVPLDVRFEPSGDVVYKLDDDLDHENWNFALVVRGPVTDVDRLRIEHRAGSERVHAVELDGGALRAYRRGEGGETAWRNLHFRLPRVAAADAVDVTLLSGGRVRGRGRARLVRFEQRQRFRLPVRGCWLVSSGHDFGVEHRRHYSRGHFAWDLVRVDAQGRPASGPSLLEHYSYGQPVVAPGPGVVVLARGDFDDVSPGAAGKLDEANLVVIDHGDGVRSRLLHLQKGSVRVAPGDAVAAGQVIAAAGNSGMSDSPHLHFHFERPAPGGARELPLPVQLSGYTVSWNQGAGVQVELGRPRRGQFVCGG